MLLRRRLVVDGESRHREPVIDALIDLDLVHDAGRLQLLLQPLGAAATRSGKRPAAFSEMPPPMQ